MTTEDRPEPKDVRFQMMMSATEAAALDGWASENQLRSKAEAVRQLVEIGLQASGKADTLEEMRLRLANLKRRGARQIVGLKGRIKEIPDEREQFKLLAQGLELVTVLLDEIAECSEDIAVQATRIVGPAVARRAPADLTAAINTADWLPSAGGQTERRRLEAMKDLMRRQAEAGSEPPGEEQ